MHLLDSTQAGPFGENVYPITGIRRRGPAQLTDRDRVQELSQELSRHDRGVVVRSADRWLQRLDHRVMVGLVEVDQRDEILVGRLGLWRQDPVPVGLPPGAAEVRVSLRERRAATL